MLLVYTCLLLLHVHVGFDCLRLQCERNSCCAMCSLVSQETTVGVYDGTLYKKFISHETVPEWTRNMVEATAVILDPLSS